MCGRFALGIDVSRLRRDHVVDWRAILNRPVTHSKNNSASESTITFPGCVEEGMAEATSAGGGERKTARRVIRRIGYLGKERIDLGLGIGMSRRGATARY